MYILKKSLLPFLLFCLVSLPVLAGEPTLVGTYGAWNAYKFKEGGKNVCYMASKPASAKGNYTQRGKIFSLITHRPGENAKDVFSYITGYSFKPGSEVSVVVDGRKFFLFTQDDMAWTPDSQTDKNLANAIRRGSKMVVKGTSARGTLTTDTFSLKGSGSAYDKISKECGV